MHFENVQTFDQWRTAARRLLVLQVPPGEVHFTDDADQPTLFDRTGAGEPAAIALKVPKRFIGVR